RKCGGVPHRLVQVQPHEPAIQDAVIDLLHQQPLAAHRIEHLQQLRPQQLLRRNRRTPALGIQGVKQRRHRFQNLIRQGPHCAQRMVRAHPLLRRQITEHIRLLMIDSAHDLFLTDHTVELKLLFKQPARDSYDYWTFGATITLALVGFFGVGVGVATLCYLKRQALEMRLQRRAMVKSLEAMNKQAEWMKTQAEIANRTLILQFRPKIVVRGAKSTSFNTAYQANGTCILE